MSARAEAAGSRLEEEGELRWLRARVSRLELGLLVARRKAAARRAIELRARHAAEVARVDGGRRALRAAAQGHDGVTPWPEYLEREASKLDGELLRVVQDVGRG